MTTKWKPDGIFAGKTVAVLASGPSLTQEIADGVRHLPRICARWACKLAPDADMVVAVDAPPNEGFWPWAVENFRGLKITAVETDALPEDVKFWWHRWERVTIVDPTHVIEFRNNGMSAVHLAAEAGAAKIILLGFDPQINKTFDGRTYDDEGEHYFGLTKGLQQLIAKLRAQGIEVEADIDLLHDKELRSELVVSGRPGILPSLLSLLDRVKHLDGCVAELGVYRGGTLDAMARVCPGKTCYGFDTFSGLPRDEEWSTGEPLRPGYLADVSFSAVARQLPSNCRLVRGLFPQSAIDIDDRFCFAHVDFDYGRSTSDAIAWLKPRMVPGGVIVFDDYLWRECPGVAKAIDDAGLEVCESVQYQCYWTAPADALPEERLGWDRKKK